MTINYIENGIGMHETIRAAGHWLREQNGVWISSNDAAVQALINSYNPLPRYKSDRIAAIKLDGLARIQVVFPAIKDFDALLLVREQYLSVAVASRTPTASMTSAINIYSAATTAIASVNAAASKAAVDAVVVAWP